MRRQIILLLSITTTTLLSTACVNCFVVNYGRKRQFFPSTTKLAAYTLDDSKWDSLGIEPVLEPKWYILNCMATAEFTVLKNLEDNCMGATNDIIKFSVPTETKGTSRLKKTFTEEKPLFQGYVFVNCKLTQESYDSIAQVKSVRGWMGVPRQIGYKKLLPIPCPLEGSELKKFRLLEEEQVKKEDAMATGTYDPNDPDFDISFGFQVGQYVKILSGPHANEDAIVRKFRDGKIGVRMFTYGSQFDAMFEAHELRKMNELEVAAGLQGPERSISQEEFNKQMGLPPPRRRGDQPNRNGIAARGEVQQRNRRQDRAARSNNGRDMFGRSDEEVKSESELWDAFQDSSPVDNYKRGSRRDTNIFDENAGDVMGKTTVDSNTGEDDFFSELMNELSDDLGERQHAKKKNQQSNNFNDDDDFFAMLEQEMKTSGKSNNQKEKKSARQEHSSDNTMIEDDFFAALEQEMSSSSSVMATNDDNDDDFFSALEKEMSETSSFRKSATSKHSKGDREELDFFTQLEQEMGAATDRKNSKGKSPDDDFFASLDNSDSNLVNEKEIVTKETEREQTATKAVPKQNGTALTSMTVVQLRDLLRDKGLPVSGKKAELVERLQNYQ